MENSWLSVSLHLPSPCSIIFYFYIFNFHNSVSRLGLCLQNKPSFQSRFDFDFDFEFDIFKYL